MAGPLNRGRVAIVTGAGRGIGRAHALELARQGACVVVNDRGGAVDGEGASAAPALEVVEEISAAGGTAIADGEDVSDWEGARRLVDHAIARFGRLDVLVANAGILRDRMLANMSVEDWDSVITVHLRGTFAPARWAASHWRARAKAGEGNDARLITTTSASGLYGNVGQTNYGAAKAGIAAFTVIAAAELARYGVTVNAIAPSALTRMTEQATGAQQGTDANDPANMAPVVAWLASPEAARVTGRVFNVRGGHLSVAEGWSAGPSAVKVGRWDPTELGPVIADLLARAAGPADLYGVRPVRTEG